MSESNYQYFADDDSLWQVTLEDDVAGIFGLSPAGGGEPYLSTLIAPRTVAYQSQRGDIRTAIIGTSTQLAQAPLQISISGTPYTRIRSFGESRNAFVNPYPFLPSGPPGPPGPPGPGGAGLTVYSDFLTSNLSVPSGAGDTLVNSVSLPAGNYIILACFSGVQSGAGAVAIGGYVGTGGGVVPCCLPYVSLHNSGDAAGTFATGLFSCTALTTLTLFCQDPGNAAQLLGVRLGHGTGNITGLMALKYS